MTVIKYIPIDYFTYNRPYYVATVLIVTMFSIIYIMLYLIFKYEYLNRLEICDPMFYYSRPCNNEYSKLLLFNDQFLTFKKNFYDIISKFNPKTKETEGVRANTAKNKEIIENADEKISDNIQSNEDFSKSTIEEINNMTTVAKLITSKYLGNLQELFGNVQNAPQYLLNNLQQLSIDLGQLKSHVQETIVDPVFAKYTAPLQKLYKYLTQIDQTTLPYVEKYNESKSQL
jgi:hypothetical protein